MQIGDEEDLKKKKKLSKIPYAAKIIWWNSYIFKTKIIFQSLLTRTCFSSRENRYTSNNYPSRVLSNCCFPAYNTRIIMHNHLPSNIRPFPQILEYTWLQILKKKKKERKQPNYNLIYHPEAGIIFHLSPNPPYSPFFLFPSSPLPSRNYPSFRDGSIASLTISRHGKRSTRRGRTSEES